MLAKQDVLDWDRNVLRVMVEGLLTYLEVGHRLFMASCLLWGRVWIACRWLNCLQLHNLEIRRDCAHLFRCCRLLVVFTEGGDLCSLNKESLLETCEIGVQGVSSAGHSCA